MALPDGLFDAVKSYLDITWALTDAESAKLTGIIERGIAYIDRHAGAHCDYSAEGQPRALLMDYVRYVRSDAFDEFQSNYLHEIIGLQISEGGEVVDTEPA